MLQAVGLVARFDDVAVVCQPIQQLASPNTLDHSVKKVGRDDQAGVLV
ncbi:hypothetical protein AK973_2121 [Pseudomonas brassicacearum]|nr:hypothetical protein AK973_2121 [Pseudomonas brassicacearum]